MASGRRIRERLGCAGLYPGLRRFWDAGLRRFFAAAGTARCLRYAWTPDADSLSEGLTTSTYAIPLQARAILCRPCQPQDLASRGRGGPARSNGYPRKETPSIPSDSIILLSYVKVSTRRNNLPWFPSLIKVAAFRSETCRRSAHPPHMVRTSSRLSCLPKVPVLAGIGPVPVCRRLDVGTRSIRPSHRRSSIGQIPESATRRHSRVGRHTLRIGWPSPGTRVGR